MSTDYWPQEEGYIVEGAPVAMCIAAAAIGEMSCVKLNSTAAGSINVAASAAVGDSIGVALRAAIGTGDTIPVAFGGIVKMITGGTLALMDTVESQGVNTAEVIQVANSTDMAIADQAGDVCLGMALHAGVTLGDEILVLLGRR